MATARDLLPTGLDEFSTRVDRVPQDAWQAATPCAEWSVRDLVNHLTGEHLWVPHLLAGETMDQVGDRYDGDVLGADPVSAWHRAAEGSRKAWRELPSDDEPVELSFGRSPAGEYAEQMLLDLVVHTWDLARGAGIDERLPPAAVAHALDYAAVSVELWQGIGIFAPPVEVTSDDPQERLLGLTGRRVGA